MYILKKDYHVLVATNGLERTELRGTLRVASREYGRLLIPLMANHSYLTGLASHNARELGHTDPAVLANQLNLTTKLSEPLRCTLMYISTNAASDYACDGVEMLLGPDRFLGSGTFDETLSSEDQSIAVLAFMLALNYAFSSIPGNISIQATGGSLLR